MTKKLILTLLRRPLFYTYFFNQSFAMAPLLLSFLSATRLDLSQTTRLNIMKMKIKEALITKQIRVGH
jgi:hypothetical protein